MNPKYVLNTVVAVFALSPLAALAEGGTIKSEQEWLAKVAQGPAGAQAQVRLAPLPRIGNYQPAQAPAAQTADTRDEVKADLARHGSPMVAA